MDRSYLSNSEVIQASRDFICVRLATYEDAEEMEFMASIYDYRTPTRNSLFAILDPSAKRHLVKPGRSMKTTFTSVVPSRQREDRALFVSQDGMGVAGRPWAVAPAVL